MAGPAYMYIVHVHVPGSAMTQSSSRFKLSLIFAEEGAAAPWVFFLSSMSRALDWASSSYSTHTQYSVPQYHSAKNVHNRFYILLKVNDGETINNCSVASRLRTITRYWQMMKSWPVPQAAQERNKLDIVKW